MFKELLPIGSVVLLKGGIKKIMVTGIKPVSKDDDGTEQEYDYIGCLLYTSPSPRDLSTSRMPSSA